MIFHSIAFDLLRIDIYSFKAFCEYFFTLFPGHFLSPLRISGSAVESLFSQYKYNANGKLDAVNYATARTAHLVQQAVSSHHSGSGYRDNKLLTPSLLPRKKLYNKK